MLCCFPSLARWMDPFTGKETASGETTGSGMAILQFCQEGDIIQIGYTHPTGIFIAQSLAPICILCGVLCTILHILVKFPHYDKEHLTLHLHGTLCNILGDGHHSMFNILELVSSMRIIKYISLVEFCAFIVILMTISLYSYCYFMTSSAVPYTARQTIPFYHIILFLLNFRI